MSWDDDDWDLCRRCEAAYDDAQQREKDCASHPGRKVEGTWDCCGRRDRLGCQPDFHVRATPEEARAIRAARRARRRPRDMAAEAAGIVADERGCGRCGQRYREAENGPEACGYEADGAARGWHIETPAGAVGPLAPC